MGLLVINPGLCSTVQDAGRVGYREWGVPVSGAFDRASYELANALLGNAPGTAALELTLIGGVYEAQVPLAIALTGAPMEACVLSRDGSRRPLHVPQTLSLDAGERLVLGGTPRGARTYLAVKGGVQTPLILGSRSSEVRLQAGDMLPAEPGTTLVRRPTEGLLAQFESEPIRIIDGPDAKQAEPIAWDSLTFLVGSQSDRMGLRLEGPTLMVPVDPERMSTPVAPGAVQVTGEQILILGVACGTMGGYPHVAHVITADLDRLGQARPGAAIRLRRVSLEEAWQIDRGEQKRRRAWLEGVSAAIAQHRPN